MFCIDILKQIVDITGVPPRNHLYDFAHYSIRNRLNTYMLEPFDSLMLLGNDIAFHLVEKQSILEMKAVYVLITICLNILPEFTDLLPLRIWNFKVLHSKENVPL